MMLNECSVCTTRYAVGIDWCPNCGHIEERDMPKTTVHQGSEPPNVVEATEPHVEAPKPPVPKQKRGRR